eukprot:CAMPEP_0194209080 /NCGR_PEP_ID=MMETSP0156-20130528/7331_1 /TAXON_ID=33649 /ORGANISM="Thalassionema nitzschioides, Strain L26-B" /LENGTH=280 /DNA_ID=CAMNT_0038936179 /DNA_START=52 /DNA_END=891 /DNA_ORIENTATION=-
MSLYSPYQSPRNRNLNNPEGNDDDDNDDEIKLASFLFCLVGIGYLFPFSALTQPADYWSLLFPSFHVEFSITAIYMYTNLVSLAILVFFCPSNSNFSRKIVLGFVGQLLVLVIVPSSYFLHLDEISNAICILGLTALVAIITAFLDSAVIALSTQYPLRVQETFQLGVGVSTLIGSVYRDVTKLAFPPSMLVESSLFYFYGGAATIGVCLWAFQRLLSLKISQKALSRAKQQQEQQKQQQSFQVTNNNNNPTTELSCLIGNNNKHDVVAIPPPPPPTKKW